MASESTRKTKASPKLKTTRVRQPRKPHADKITMNPEHGQPPGPQGEMADEDRTGRFIGRFGGAGQPTLPKH